MTGSGPAGEKRAKALARREAIQNALIGFAPTALIRRFFLPKPGQGPSKAARDADISAYRRDQRWPQPEGLGQG